MKDLTKENEEHFFHYPEQEYRVKTLKELLNVATNVAWRQKRNLQDVVYNLLHSSLIRKDTPEVGRLTIAGIYNKKKKEIIFGVSSCSKKDLFVKETGRRKAIGRARQENPIHIIEVKEGSSPLTQFIIEARKLAQKINNRTLHIYNSKLVGE